jgi:hypothetical protein
MARYSDFHAAINVVMPGVAIPIIDSVLRFVLEDFCEKTRTWQIALPITLDGDNSIVDVVTPNAALLDDMRVSVVDVLAVTLDGKPIDTDYYPWKRVARKGFEWVRRALQAGELSVVVSVKPMPHCGVLDDGLYANWRDAIACGVADRLQRQPGKAWSDIRAAKMNEDRYDEHCNKALFEANNHRNGVTIAQSKFWMG